MKTWILGAFVSLTALAVLTVPLRPSARSVHSGTPVNRVVEGQVTSVDPKEETVTVKGEREVLKMGFNTYITRDGEPVKLPEIKAGDEVRASFISDDSTHVFRLEARSGERGHNG